MSLQKTTKEIRILIYDLNIKVFSEEIQKCCMKMNKQL